MFFAFDRLKDQFLLSALSLFHHRHPFQLQFKLITKKQKKEKEKIKHKKKQKFCALIEV